MPSGQWQSACAKPSLRAIGVRPNRLLAELLRRCLIGGNLYGASSISNSPPSCEVLKFATYRLRYFIDVWAGDCLWSANDAALERFGYPVFLEDLGLSDNALQFAKVLIERLQDEVTRESIGYGIPHIEQLEVDAGRFLSILRKELGPDFEILDGRH